MRPRFFVAALMDRAARRNLDVLLEDDHGPASKKLSLPFRDGTDSGHASGRKAVHIVATGELGMIDSDDVYNFVRPNDGEDQEDVNETADDFVDLTVAYLRAKESLSESRDGLADPTSLRSSSRLSRARDWRRRSWLAFSSDLIIDLLD